jgi:hypothetical protein
MPRSFDARRSEIITPRPTCDSNLLARQKSVMTPYRCCISLPGSSSGGRLMDLSKTLARRSLILYFGVWWKSFVGKDLFKILCPEAQRLRTTMYCSTTKYAKISMAQVVQHKLIPKLHSIYKETNGSLSPEQQKLTEISRLQD